MTRVKILALLMGMVLLLSIPAIVSAQQQLPHMFVGSATLDDAAAADGTEVTAWVDGTQAGDAVQVTDGSYSILVDPGTSSWADKVVSFQVGGNDAEETAVFVHGAADELNLTAVAAAAAIKVEEAIEEEATGGPGATGARGARGFRGLEGEAGEQGEEGLQGATGGLGRRGEAGADGTAGAPGSAGTDGSPGPQGTQGGPGQTGPAGDSGSSGLGVVALILAIIAIVGAGGAFLLSRRG